MTDRATSQGRLPGGGGSEGQAGVVVHPNVRVPGFDFDVPVVLDPTCEHRGIVSYEGFQNHPVIRLREWHQRVFLHETLHVLVAAWRHAHQRDDLGPYLTPGTPQEEEFVRHLTHLYEMGWRLEGADA